MDSLNCNRVFKPIPKNLPVLVVDPVGVILSPLNQVQLCDYTFSHYENIIDNNKKYYANK